MFQTRLNRTNAPLIAIVLVVILLGASTLLSVSRPLTAVAQTETDDNPSGNLTASATTIDVGQSVKLTVTDLQIVGTHVRFKLRGSLSFRRDCSDPGRRDLVPPPPEVTIFKASVDIYGCAPGGSSTAIVETLAGVFIDDLRITVNRPVTLTADDATIHIGGSTKVRARNLPEDGSDTVTFALIGPLSTDRRCPSRSSTRSITGGPDATIYYTASLTVFGCSPGGTGTVVLRTDAGRELKRVQINVNPPPPVMTATLNPIYIGQSTAVRVSRLPADVGRHVTFRFKGPLHYDARCGITSTQSSETRSDTRQTFNYFARTTVYGCAPHGEGTVILETSDGVRLASMRITVKPPRLKVPQEPINVGQRVTIVATDLYNVSSVIFGLSGPLRFNQSCTAERSRSANTLRSPRAGGRASVDIYGCAPGGTGIITLKNQDRTILNNASITVNPPSGNMPTGEIGASLTTIDIGALTSITVSNLDTHGNRPTLVVEPPILHAETNCGLSVVSSDSDRSGGQTITITDQPNRTYDYYGCLPGGNVTVTLRVGDFDLDSVTINIVEPPEYSPYQGINFGFGGCDTAFGYPTKKASDVRSIVSPGGYVHTAIAEIWEGLNNLNPDLRQFLCVEGRFITTSSPGATNVSISGTLYEVERTSDNLPTLNWDSIIENPYDEFERLFQTILPNRDGKSLDTLDTVLCEICEGKTVRTHGDFVMGRLFMHSTLHITGEHTFEVGGWSETLNTTASVNVSPHSGPRLPLFTNLVSDELDGTFGDHQPEQIANFISWLWRGFQSNRGSE